MKIEKKALPKSIVELIVEEGVKEVAKYRKKAVAYIEKNADIKGFRKGSKIPEEVIVRQYGEEYINKITIEFAIDNIYREALKKEKIIPVAEGQIKEIISESPLKIKIHIETLPEVEIDKKYKKISLKKQKISVTAAEVKKAIEEIETKFTKFEEKKNTKAAMNDKVTIDTDGYEGEKLMESTSMRDYPIVLGSNVLVPGFEESIVGAKAGDDLEFPVEFPKDYHNKDFAGKKSTFKVKVKKIEKAVKPEWTEEFIEQLRGQKLDFNGFKDLIKAEITETKESNARLEEESKLIEELLKVSKVDIGEKMLANQIEKVYAEIKENMSSQNIKVAHYLESLKLTEEEYKEKNVKPTALKRLQGELILHKLSEIETVEITDAEMQKEIDVILKKFGSEDVLKRLKELYVPGQKYYEELKIRTKYRKIIDSFFETK